MPQTYVIVGAGLAGAKAAQTLREEGFDGRLLLIGEEDERPYERPPLSKGFLLGKEDRNKAYVHEEGWYAAHDVELRLGARVDALDLAARRVELAAGGERIGFDKLLLATGASPRRLPLPGGDLDGIHYLRTLADSERLRAALAAGASVVVVGAGWIGLEIAAAARHYDCPVTVVEPEATPLYRALGPELGELFADLHRRHGVVFRFGAGVREFRGEAGRVRAVVTADDAELPAEVVVVGVGARPNAELAERAGLDVDNGVLVDAALRTSHPDVFAVGDIANAFHPLLGRRIRVEHWANALNGGPAAARAMLGRDVVYDLIPYFYTDQYELGMEASGLPTPGAYDAVVYRGDRDALEFIVFWTSAGRVVAGMNVNVWDVVPDIQELIRSGRPVDAARLADPKLPLTEV